MRLPKPPGSRAWLWWLGLLLLVVGSWITFIFYHQRIDPEARIAMSISLMLTVISVGICVICATADWWIKR
jgi:hypothetical protein